MPLPSAVFAALPLIIGLGAARLAGLTRLDGFTDLDEPLNPAWANYLQTENGEPIRSAEGPFLEVA